MFAFLALVACTRTSPDTNLGTALADTALDADTAADTDTGGDTSVLPGPEPDAFFATATDACPDGELACTSVGLTLSDDIDYDTAAFAAFVCDAAGCRDAAFDYRYGLARIDELNPGERGVVVAGWNTGNAGPPALPGPADVTFSATCDRLATTAPLCPALAVEPAYDGAEPIVAAGAAPGSSSQPMGVYGATVYSDDGSWFVAVDAGRVGLDAVVLWQ